MRYETGREKMMCCRAMSQGMETAFIMETVEEQSLPWSLQKKLALLTL